MTTLTECSLITLKFDAYVGLDGTPGVDGNDVSSGGGTAYRPDDTSNQGNEVNGDVKRAQYVALGTNDYDIGWTAAGQWANYTRTYPAGVYNVMFRAAGNTGGRRRGEPLAGDERGWHQQPNHHFTGPVQRSQYRFVANLFVGPLGGRKRQPGHHYQQRQGLDVAALRECRRVERQLPDVHSARYRPSPPSASSTPMARPCSNGPIP